jgi:hypothetical protein
MKLVAPSRFFVALALGEAIKAETCRQADGPLSSWSECRR